MRYFNYTDKKNTAYRVILVSVFFCASLFASGCDFGLQAIIMSPGLSQITIQKCETVAFEGFGIGGFPFESNDSESGDLYGYYWDADGNSIDKRTDKRIDITFKNEGTFTVSFTVTDKRGTQDEVETIVIVVPNENDTDCDDDDVNTDAPEATITSPSIAQNIETGEQINFIGKGEGGTPFTDANTEPYNYSWDTDGNTPATSNAKTVLVTFAKEGRFTVTFYVTDKKSVKSAAATIAITVTAASNGSDGIDDNCQGCCSSHGGVVCRDGVTECGDGTPLTEDCSSGGCDTCSGN